MTLLDSAIIAAKPVMKPSDRAILEKLDDAKLTPAQFRLYFRIKRQLRDGVCSDSAVELAQACQMNIKTCRKALVALQNKKLIEVKARSGKSSLISLVS